VQGKLTGIVARLQYISAHFIFTYLWIIHRLYPLSSVFTPLTSLVRLACRWPWAGHGLTCQCSSNETKQNKQSHAIDNFLNAGILQQHCIA
jgi:hypothetical protein